MRASGWLRLSAVILSLAVAAARAPAQQTALGLFHGQTDVGQVTKRGSVTYDAVRERYTIAGSGANMWFDRDDFHFVWRRDRKSTRLNSSHSQISYAVFCLKKKHHEIMTFSAHNRRCD